MAYFVTGATGFIGQFLMRKLLARGKPIHVLVRKGSLKKLDALRVEWGASEKEVIPVIGDLEEESRHCRRRPEETQGQGGAFLSPRRHL